MPEPPRPPASRILPGRPTAARSERAESSIPAGTTLRAIGSTASIAAVGVSIVALRPPITYTRLPSAAAAAWVVGLGRRPMRVTRPVAGSNESTASLAVPAGVEPPAITIRPATAATAA